MRSATARPHMDQGKVATYIPELAKGDPTKLGICIRTPDGEEYCQGDCQTEFSIQSISKTITLILAFADRRIRPGVQQGGHGAHRRRLQLHDPAGDPDHPPHEPHDQRRGPLPPPAAASRAAPTPSGRFSLARTLCGRETIRLNKEGVYLGVSGRGRNRAMAYFMQSENLLEWDAEDVVELYFKMCSINVNVRDLAHYGLVLACNGKDPATGRQLVDPGSAAAL